MTHKLSRRAMLAQLSAPALLVASGCGRGPAASANLVHIATASGGMNLTMSELLRQQKFLESFDLTPEVIAMADGNKILGGLLHVSPGLTVFSSSSNRVTHPNRQTFIR